MSQYCTVQMIREMLGGTFGPDPSLGPGAQGSTRDSILASLAETYSRNFDRETGKAYNFWATNATAVRRYSGTGDQWLDIDDFQSITGVTMSTNQSRSDAITLTTTDPTQPGIYVVMEPFTGPPFNRLFLLRGWLPDAFNVKNVEVDGSIVTPSEIANAVAIWVAYIWRSRDAGFADMAGHVGGPGQLYVRGIPPETARVIDYYKNETGPKAALTSGSPDPRLSPWLGWRVAGNN